VERIGEELIKLLSQQCQETTCSGKKNSLDFQLSVVPHPENISQTFFLAPRE